MLRVLGVLAVGLVVGWAPATAQAQVFGLQAHGDMGRWAPEPTFWGFGGTAAVDHDASEHVDVGGRLRFATFPWRGEGTNRARTGEEVEPSTGHQHVALSAAVRVHSELQRGRPAPYGQLALGVGAWRGCIRGDSCGGVGALVGAEAGMEVRFSPQWSWLAGAQLLLQTGLANGVDWLWLPGVTVGLRFGGGD